MENQAQALENCVRPPEVHVQTIMGNYLDEVDTLDDVDIEDDVDTELEVDTLKGMKSDYLRKIKT